MVVSEPKLLGYTGPGVQLRPHTIGRRAASVGGSSTPRSAVPLATSASASAKTSREMCGGSVSPSPIHTVRFRMEQVGTTERDRKLLQQALQESQAALCNEARRAGVAEALLRERTATLAAVAHYCTGVGDQSSPKRLQASKARSPGTSSTSVGSELQVEIQHATLHDKLADKLAQTERQALALRQSEQDLQLKADAAVQEAEQLRAKLQMSERNAAAALLQQQTELVQLSSHMEAVQSELAGTRELLEMKTLQANRLQLDRKEKETLQVELAKVQERLSNKVEETKQLREAKRELEVKLLSYKEHHGVGEDGQLSRIAELEVKVDKLSQQVANTEIELGAQQGNKAELEDCNKALKEQLDKAHLQRMELHNTVQELKGNIRVFCRVRPTKESPIAAQTHDYNKVSLGHAGETYTFSFDKVLGPTSEQIDVYDEVSGLVQSALDGYKVSIFAYGQTGSGKTYTMQGTSGDTAESGLIPRSLMTIFQATEEMKMQGWAWSVQVSFMEVYNETLRDLLRGSGDAAAGPTDGHVIVQDEAWGAMVTGMTCVEVDSVDKINQLMVKAAKQRAVGETNMNATSSRSHSIFALYLKGCNAASGTEIHGALHMVDLAGSERLDKSGASGERLKETQNINKSLSSLADVFAAKAESRSHIPFRNSKLTYLMEPCLSGHGKTLMLVTIQPETHSAHESLCSLRFAKQVSQCNTGGRPRRNIKTMERTPTCKRLNSQANSKRLGHMAGTQSMKCPRSDAQEDKVLGTESCPVQGHSFFPLRRNAESAENIGSVERTSPERGSPRLRTSQSLGTKRGSSTPRC